MNDSVLLQGKGVIVIVGNGIAARSLPQTFDTVVGSLCHGANDEALAGRRDAPRRRCGQRLTLVGIPVLLGAVTAGATGCGGASVATPPASTTVKTSTTGDLRDEIWHVYENFWTVSNKVVHDDAASWRPELAVVAVDPQLSRMVKNLTTLQSRMITVYGTTYEHMTKVDIDGTAATVSDCQDASESGQADAHSGERKTVGIPRNPVMARMQRGADGKWKVAEISYPGGTC